MTRTFDPEYMAAYFDRYGEAEWARHDRSPSARVAFAVHCAFLRDHVRSGDLVLEAGAGAGRFTVELARLGARVHVGDLSPVQLELNAQHVAEADVTSSVVGRDLLNVCDLSRFDDATFDAVVCYGGPLSYVRGSADRALGELVRVTRTGGTVLMSVMSTLGSLRAFLPCFLEEGRRFGSGHCERMFSTGELKRETNNGHEMKMYRWSEFAELCQRYGDLVDHATANFLSVTSDPASFEAMSDEEWAQLVSFELRLCREPGVLDGGTHMLAALRTG
ncbi:MAG TPA: class I SAM-dependent methyltransferase [Acidimicrobiia bacterium]|nr:class I SAM-dependent methyltransferase [Acidimicrobiia bacterium]